MLFISLHEWGKSRGIVTRKEKSGRDAVLPNRDHFEVFFSADIKQNVGFALELDLWYFTVDDTTEAKDLIESHSKGKTWRATIGGDDSVEMHQTFTKCWQTAEFQPKLHLILIKGNTEIRETVY